ncbi:MAG: hypothetical protein HKN32_06460, partial [Flavobacteriales bacterium]|nr:hypothetical protein [Flavobacteriales bacterium]
AMLSSDKIRIQYAAKQSRISNAYKKWIGQNNGLRILNALEVKRDQEQKLRDTGRDNAARLQNFEKAYQDLEKYQFGRDLFIEYYYYGPEFLRFAQRIVPLVNNYEKLEASGELQAQLDDLKGATSRHFKDYHLATDKDVFLALSELYAQYLDRSLSTPMVKAFMGNETALNKLADDVYTKSFFTDESRMNGLIDGFSAKSVKKIKKDKGYLLMEELLNNYFDAIRPGYSENQGAINSLMKEHVIALEQVFPDRVFWPDANSTLRLTYGKAEGSSPRDGMIYKFYTTSEGILNKYVPGDRDFDLPADLVTLLEKRDFGPYATDGELRVCFTGSNHTTGGNSGSPALNGDGYLIGLNFDRSWESTMSDIMFDPDRCRNIMVDIKYVLFIIDRYAGAKHLIREMTLVSNKHKEKPESEVAPMLN